jgi:hypothetical protein
VASGKTQAGKKTWAHAAAMQTGKRIMTSTTEKFLNWQHKRQDMKGIKSIFSLKINKITTNPHRTSSFLPLLIIIIKI